MYARTHSIIESEAKANIPIRFYRSHPNLRTIDGAHTYPIDWNADSDLNNCIRDSTMKPRKQRPSTTLIVALSSLVSASQLPFHPAETASPLARREQQGGCLTNFYSCASQGAAFADICCADGQVCSLDADNNPACCPAK